uniref:J domain-containing protein n=1 Tax=viral metagenome TaxID=1070528 RepID=A0A6C0HB32_9ZZZZ
MSQPPPHNLNIHMYNLQEILGLFDLTYTITIEDLKRAKKKVLMLHPDKSRLSPDYFLFYKKAFDIILQLYENNHKQNQTINSETVKYKPLENTLNNAAKNKVKTVIGEMDKSEFNHTFNQLFNENMVKKPNQTRNDWFSKEEPIYNIDPNVSTKNMGAVLDTIKQKNAELIKYNGIQELYVNSNSGSQLYDENEDEDAEDVYISTDPFSKLKFDDLRKVHKDQTVFAVSERDINKVQQYSSVDHFMRERGKQTLTPLEKQEAEYMLAMKDKQYRERLMQKEYQANLKAMENAEKNKTVLSSFLRLT